MNIDEYRAMKAQENEQAPQQPTETPEIVTPEVVEPTTPEPTPDAPIEETPPTQPLEVDIDGKPVPIDELTQGYLRQSDYTRKTQELARERERIKIAEEYYNALHADPERAKEFASEHKLPYIDPKEMEVKELQSKYEDLLLEKEINLLSTKYPDFDATEVVKTAVEKQLVNLEDAYLLTKSMRSEANVAPPIDIEALSEQIRQQVLQELQSSVDTTSLIGKGGSTKPVTENPVELTPQEAKVARAMKMSPAEYAKWKNA